MADNVPITPGTGTNIATDDVGGVHYQKVKIDLGGDGASTPVDGELPVGGDVAHDVADSGNPVKIGGKASFAAPTSVVNGDRVDAWYSREGAAASLIVGDTGTKALVANTSGDGAATTNAGLWTLGTGWVFNGTTWDRARGDVTNGLDVDVTRLPSIPAGTNNIGDVDVASLPAPHASVTIASATAQYTTTQTSTILGPTNAAGVTMYVTSIQIQAGGTTAGNVQVYFGTGAYSRGTSRAVFDGEFAPSATLKPGYAQSPPIPYAGAAGDELRVTTSAAINPLTVTIWYYLV